MKQSLKFAPVSAACISSFAGFDPRRAFSVVGLFLLLGAAPTVRAQSTPLPPGTSSPDAQPASDPLAQAESDIEAKNYRIAEALLDVYLAEHPNDARALFDRGYAEDADGNTAVAESWYRKAIAADPKQFEAHLALGLLLEAKHDPTDDQAARDQLYAATQLQPNPPNPGAKAQADRALAELIKSSDPTGARDALVDALKLTPETPADTLLAAEIAENAGDPQIAEQEYRKLLQTQPDSSAATAGLVHLLLTERRYSDAQPLVEAALRRDPDDPALNAQLAAILNAEGQRAQALTVLEKLHQLEPTSGSVTGMLADAELQAGNLDKADALYRQLLAATPADPALLDALGQVLIREQKYPEATAAFHKAVAAKPDDADAWSGIAFAASKLHDYQGELQALSMRSKYADENAASLFLWATAYDNLHQIKAAAEYYHRFLAAAQGKFPDQEWQAKHRLAALEK